MKELDYDQYNGEAWIFIDRATYRVIKNAEYSELKIGPVLTRFLASLGNSIRVMLTDDGRAEDSGRDSILVNHPDIIKFYARNQFKLNPDISKSIPPRPSIEETSLEKGLPKL